MRIEEAIKEDIFDDDEDEKSLEFESQGGRGGLKLSDGFGMPRYVYRTVSREEYEDIKESGVIKPSEFYQRIHVSAIPTYGDGSSYAVLKIVYDSSDGWKDKETSVGIVGVTWSPVSSDKIEDTLNPRSVRGAQYEYSLEEQYRMFQQ